MDNLSNIIYIKRGKKKINLKVHKVSFFGRFSGLMFRTRKVENLLFEFSEDVNYSIHSLFVFFPFLAVWLDKNNNVVDKKIVFPFILSVKTKKMFRKLVEIPLNNENTKIVDFLVGKKRFK